MYNSSLSNGPQLTRKPPHEIRNLINWHLFDHVNDEKVKKVVEMWVGQYCIRGKHFDELEEILAIISFVEKYQQKFYCFLLY